MNASTPADRIVSEVLKDVAAREAVISFKEIKASSRDAPAVRDGIGAILRSGCGVIAEIKRAVPGRRPFVEDPSVDSIIRLAHELEDGGAHLIACQTERLRFHGSLEDMKAARAAVDVPMLCRDLIIDPYQIHEARFFGADLVPLQVELLDQPRFESLLDRVESLGMTAVAEVRTPEEADRAMTAGARVVAVNARSLIDGRIDRQLFAGIVPGLPEATLRIAMSGVRSPKDLLSYASAGADAVVVGEEIMLAEDPTRLTRSLVAAGQHPSCPSR
ncbi:indole-3-glycerol phosphate synthase TrpC [Corynebacterium alimapuense]|uniref:indole-3-glycerol-phosphate synthase n=1 Tax=Corynebacterium alimapuense TaxID=1576874 RepID=A0A3M8K890_9CORY|nr:indole-3-glycerol phosphate synthase TrpC [Corynebacterium alimapuense]RNE49447.1 indole-3-glycerol-phosphate synthase TrpC [Corynebacterium alimapuense]